MNEPCRRGMHACTPPVIASPYVQMAIFMEQLQKVKEQEKRVKSSLHVHLGQDPPTQAEVDRMGALRAEHAARTRAREAEAAARRTETELHVAGARSMHSAAAPDTEAAPGSQEAGSGADHPPQAIGASHARDQTTPPQRIIDALQCGVTYNDLAKRMFSRNRFVQTGRLVVIR